MQDGFSFYAALQKREYCGPVFYLWVNESAMLSLPFPDCSRRYDVVNRGFSGYNTSQALKILEQVFPKPEAGGPKLKYLVSLANLVIAMATRVLDGTSTTSSNKNDAQHTHSLILKPYCPTISLPSPSKLSLSLTQPHQLVLLGANDAALPQEVDNQGIPLDQYKANLHEIITHPHITAHAPTILIITPPPLDEIRTTELDTPKYGHTLRQTARSATYSQAAREVAGKAAKGSAPQKVVLVDLQRAMMEVATAKTPGWEVGQPPLGSVEGGRRGYLEALLPDGLHLSGEAYRILWGLVETEIEPRFPNQNAEGYVYPEWRAETL